MIKKLRFFSNLIRMIYIVLHCAERFLSTVDFECLKPRSSSPVRTSPSLPFALLVLIEPGGKHRRRMTQMTQGARVDGPSEAQDPLTIFKNSN